MIEIIYVINMGMERKSMEMFGKWNGFLLYGYEIFLNDMSGSDSTGLEVPIKGVDTAFASFYGILVHIGAWVSLIAFLCACVVVYMAKKGQQLDAGKKWILTICVIVMLISGLPFFIDLIQESFATL